MESLNDIGVAEDTDKAALSHRGSHHYADIYELLFREWITHAPSLLEIGVLDGGSIRMWRRFFKYGKVTAIDVNDRVNFSDDDRIEFIHGDAYGDEVIGKLSGREFDILIDDGSHFPEHQRIFLQRYASLLSPGGIMIV